MGTGHFSYRGGRIRLSGLHPNGLGYANALFGGLFATWAFLIARARQSPTLACIVGVYTLLLIVAPFVLGGRPNDFTYAMVYNRYGYALVGIVLLECAADMLCANDRNRYSVTFAVSTGVALGLLLFLKISYALFAVAFIAVLPFVGSAGGVRRMAVILGSFAGVALIALSYLRFDVADVVRDLTMAAHSRVLALDPSTLLGILCLENAALLILAALVGSYRAVFITLLTIIIGSVALITNQQRGGFPLDAYAALALVAAAGKAVKWPTAVTLMTALCVVPLCEQSAMSLLSAGLQLPKKAGVVSLSMPERGTSLAFAPFIGKIKTESDGVEYVEDLRDGLTLLRNHLNKGEGVLALDEFNPFNYILGLPSPRGGFAAAAYDYIFDDAFHPSTERFFGTTSYVLVPTYKKPAPDRYPDDRDTRALMHFYGPALRARFTMIAATKHWELWRRKTAE